jgi:hypothetical protein
MEKRKAYNMMKLKTSINKFRRIKPTSCACINAKAGILAGTSVNLPLSMPKNV